MELAWNGVECNFSRPRRLKILMHREMTIRPVSPIGNRNIHGSAILFYAYAWHLLLTLFPIIRSNILLRSLLAEWSIEIRLNEQSLKRDFRKNEFVYVIENDRYPFWQYRPAVIGIFMIFCEDRASCFPVKRPRELFRETRDRRLKNQLHITRSS